jgi:hypothetical protein
MEAAVIDRPEVGLRLEGPRPMRRVTVAFRLILLLPHLLYLWVLTIVLYVTALIGWFGAVFTGHLPAGLSEFIGNIVQYQARVYGYAFLLTDRYPPFALGPADHPISVDLPAPVRLNRAAVLFRLVLAVPAAFVLLAATYGMELALVVIWLIVLISGRLPGPAFEAEASVLRYQTRMAAWFFLLTSEYPRGLFGDKVTAAPATTLPVATERPLRANPLVEPAVGEATAGPLRITRLVLSKAGRRLVVLFLVIGSLLFAGQMALVAVIGSQSTVAQRHLDRAYDDVLDAEDHYDLTVQTCALSGGADCVHAADRELALDLRTFVARVEAERYPSEALGTATDLRDDAAVAVRLLDQMTVTSDPATYQGQVRRLQDRLSNLDDDYDDLYDLLAFSD